MSRIDFGNIGPLIQQGLSSGFATGQRNRALDMEQEQRAIQNEAMRFELTQRRQAAADLLAQRDADTQILGALQNAAKVKAAIQGPAGPRPSSWRDQLQQVPGYGPLPGAQSTAAAMDKVGAQQKRQQQMGEQLNWAATIPPDVLERASGPVKAQAIKAMTDRSAMTEKYIKAADNYEYMRSIKMAKFMPEGLWDEMMSLGIQVDEQDMPESVRQRGIKRAEGAMLAQIELLTTSDTEHGEPPMVDQARRAKMMADGLQYGPAYIEQIFRAEWPLRQARVMEGQARNAYEMLNNPASTPQEKAAAQAFLGAHKLPMGRGQGRDPMMVQKITAAKQKAKQNVVDAEKEYRALTGKGNSQGRLLPPSEAEIGMAERWTAGDTDWTNSDAEQKKALAKVQAWDRYEAAKAEHDQVYESITSGLLAEGQPEAQAPTELSDADRAAVDQLLKGLVP